MGTNPKPVQRIGISQCKRPPVQTNANGIQRDCLTDALVIQACMLRVALPSPIGLPRLFLNVEWQALKAFLEVCRDVRDHRMLSSGYTSPRAISARARVIKSASDSSDASASLSNVNSSSSQEATLSCFVSGSLETSAIAFWSNSVMAVTPGTRWRGRPRRVRCALGRRCGGECRRRGQSRRRRAFRRTYR